MISLIEAMNYRCLRYVHRPLKPFHVLVGPNGSGKTTFLDVVAILSRLVADGLDAALAERTSNFADLLWKSQGHRFELAVEATIPEDRRELLADARFDTVRYEVAFEVDEHTLETYIAAEKGSLKVAEKARSPRKGLFPAGSLQPRSIITPLRAKEMRTLFNKAHGGNDYYHADAHGNEGRWAPSFKLGRRKSTLGNLPEDESNFPVSTWFKQFLSNGVERLVLNSLQIRKASPPGQETGFKADGSNLPWVIADLQAKHPAQVEEWIRHLRIALPDLQAVRTVVREDDRHRYLKVVYDGGLEIPSWMASDGTLRLLALTLPAYLSQLKNVYLIEEPENGVHPRAVDTMYQSLSSVYDAQILMATHSPVILSAARPEDVLCFAKTDDGATDIVSGDEHPELSDWRGEVNLGTLFASGVLG
jgi:predicted ATPase